MQRVKSHDLSQEEQCCTSTTAHEQQQQQGCGGGGGGGGEPVTSPLGAGLPLLSRLRLVFSAREKNSKIDLFYSFFLQKKKHVFYTTFTKNLSFIC